MGRALFISLVCKHRFKHWFINWFLKGWVQSAGFLFTVAVSRRPFQLPFLSDFDRNLNDHREVRCFGSCSMNFVGKAILKSSPKCSYPSRCYWNYASGQLCWSRGKSLRCHAFFAPCRATPTRKSARNHIFGISERVFLNPFINTVFINPESKTVYNGAGDYSWLRR